MLESLPPVIGGNPRVLILGSMPGPEALKYGEYYKNKTNRLWKFLFRYFKREFTVNTPYAVRKKLAADNGIAFWDVIKSCERKDPISSEETASDGHITNVIPNLGIESLVKEHGISTILLNGGKAQREFKKHFRGLYNSGICKELKSTSSMTSCVISEADLYAEWKAALDSVFGY